MSNSAYPIIWAMKHAPVADAYERLVLIAMADAADPDGCNSYRSIGQHTDIAVSLDRSTIIRRQQAMKARGLIREDTSPPPARYLRIPADKRPVRWEICIPYSWWSDAQREVIQREREDKGLPPLTPESRPDLAPAPVKKARADKGVPNPNRRKKEKRGVSETPRETAESEERGVSETPGGVSTRHSAGCLQDTQPSPIDPPQKPSPSSPPPPTDTTPPKLQPFRRNGEEEDLQNNQQAKADRLVQSLPWPRQPTVTQRNRLTKLVAACLARGWTVETLQPELVTNLGGAQSVYAVWTARLRDLPGPPAGPAPGPQTLPPRCDDPRHDPAMPADRHLYDEERRPSICPRCHPRALRGVPA